MLQVQTFGHRTDVLYTKHIFYGIYMVNGKTNNFYYLGTVM